MILSCVVGLTMGGALGGIAVQMTSQATCALPHTSSSLFKTEPVPLTGYKSY